MARTKGLATFAGNFEVEKRGPVDARYTVDLITDLIDTAVREAHDGNEWTYDTMFVAVKEDHNIYMLTDPDYTDMANWKIVGGDTGSIVKKIWLDKGVKKEFEHGLNTGNLHISAYFNGHPVEVAVNDVMENTMTATADVSGLYTFVITNVFGMEYKNYSFLWTKGIAVTELINFTTENVFLPTEDGADGTIVDGKLYALMHDEQLLHELDPITGLDIRPPIALGFYAYDLQTDGENLYLAGGGHTAFVKVNISSWAISASIPMDRPMSSEMNFTDGLIYVIEGVTGILREVDMATFALTGRSTTVPSGANECRCVVHKQNYVYVTYYGTSGGGGALHRVEKSGFTFVDSVVTPRGCGGAVIVKNEIIFPCYNGNAIIGVDIVTNSIVRNITHNGVWTIGNVRNKLYISGWSNQDLSEYDLDTNSYTGRVNSLGGYPAVNKTF